MALVHETKPARLDCRICRLTPLGRGAVATVVADGSDALRLVEANFQSFSGKELGQFPVSRIVVGHWHGGTGTVEEVVVCRRSTARIEIHSHGGRAASEATLRSLEGGGALREDADSWLAREVGDPIQRAAWQALAHARTERTAAILLDQFRGALRTKLTEIIALLRPIVPSNTPPTRNDRLEAYPTAARRDLQCLLESSRVGLHLTNPWRVVIAGEPNVGKSSLINALLGYERSIVFDEPGTTRDVVMALTAFDGWPIELVDTAGLRESTDAIEREGVLRARGQMAAADLTVLVIDATANDSEAPQAPLVVANKVDLLADEEEFASRFPVGACVFTSAKTGAGIEHLIQTIVRHLVPIAPPRGAAVPFTVEQVAACRAASEALEQGKIEQAVAALESVVAAYFKPNSSTLR